ncbi:hypothetical protein MSAN_01990500 [Mycena sanguinolenta]|uniref:Uncharacterized protein n=1 Tax=Mycena sanguinolenta TaxID=230812 RepID=A0A8H6XJJ9_9AGAR|nr:hypothetical protein MSAN_01990500 [Mycena sanguinolenta]
MNHPYSGAASYIYAREHPGTPPRHQHMNLYANLPNPSNVASTSASRRSHHSRRQSTDGAYTRSQRLEPNRYSAALPPRRASRYSAPAPAPRTPLPPPNAIPQHMTGPSLWFETPSPEAPPALPLPDPPPRESYYSTRRSTSTTRRSSSLLAHSHVASPSPPPSFTTATSPVSIPYTRRQSRSTTASAYSHTTSPPPSFATAMAPVSSPLIARRQSRSTSASEHTRPRPPTTMAPYAFVPQAHDHNRKPEKMSCGQRLQKNIRRAFRRLKRLIS